MTMDNGMDVSPSWEELREERDDALERLYVMRVKLHEAFMMPVSVAPGSAEAEELQDLRDMIGEAGSQFDTEAGIERLKAEWQAEALERLGPGLVDIIDRSQAKRMAAELRRQASEPTHD